MLLAYETLQFSIDTAVMFTIVALCVSSICLPTMPPTLTMFSSMFFKDKHKDMEPSRIPNLVCFSLIFSLSLMAAIGLAIRAAYGNGFCEEFISTSSGECKEAGFAVAMSWTSVIVGGLTYHSQPVPCEFLICPFSHRRHPGFLAGQTLWNHGGDQGLHLTTAHQRARAIEATVSVETHGHLATHSCSQTCSSICSLRATGSSKHSRLHSTRPSSDPPKELAENSIDQGPLLPSPLYPHENIKQPRLVNVEQGGERADRTGSEESTFIHTN